MVGIECNGEEGPHQKKFFQGSFQTSASKNCIIVDIVNCFMLLQQSLSNSFLILIFFH